MKKKEYGRPSFLRTGRRILVGTLALSMALSGTTWASLNRVMDTTVKTQRSIRMGDVNFDGGVDLTDANLTLKAALKITTLTDDAKIAANVNFDGSVDLTDANQILKAALKIITLPEAPTTAPPVTDPPTTAPPVTDPPTSEPPTKAPQTPYPYPSALPDVPADPANEVAGEQMQVLNKNGAIYYKNDGILEFADPASVQKEGVELVNPFAGKPELQQTVQEATSLEAEPGKENCWKLKGASFKKQEVPDFTELDPRIYNREDPETVTYTRPEWTNGVTVSFWLKAQSKGHADPILTLANGSLMLMVRMNGSVRFEDSNDPLNCLNNGSTKFVHGTYGEWNYYTITIANDWVQVYVNGQENLFTSLDISRQNIQKFNDGFLTRYNSLVSITEADVDADIRKYTVRSGAWYYNSTYEKYMSHDKYNVFGNARFRGANCGGKLIMDLLTDNETKMWIGGANTVVGTKYTKHVLTEGSRAAGLTAYMKELTPEQISANYALAAKNMPNPNPVLPSEDPTTPTTTPPTGTPGPTADPDGGIPVSIASLNNATYDKDKNTIIFEEATGDIDKIKGVEMVNPFAGADDLKSTLEEALTGQAIFPYKDEDGNTYSNGGRGGWDRYAIQVWRGNFYDVYYGDVQKYGNVMDPRTGASTTGGTKADLMTLEQLEQTYGNQKTVFHRPKWTNGASVSFWAKPKEVDDSPLLTFYRPNGMALYVDVRGDVGYYSLDPKDWKKGVAGNGNPRNTFATLGNPDAVKAGEWNYYTVTIANDWIQVYVNGEEMVYDFVNLNRTETKNLNKGYLTRYNTIGIWTKDMVDTQGDPSGKTLEGKERNYLTKSTMIWDLDEGISEGGKNNGKDGAAIRCNNVYENPFNSISEGGSLVMDLFVDKMSKMYIGGVYTVLDNDMFTFSNVKVKEGTDSNLVKYEEASRKKIYATQHTLDAGTEVNGVKQYTKELTAEEVMASYQRAVGDAASPGALEVK